MSTDPQSPQGSRSGAAAEGSQSHPVAEGRQSPGLEEAIDLLNAAFSSVGAGEAFEAQGDIAKALEIIRPLAAPGAPQGGGEDPDEDRESWICLQCGKLDARVTIIPALGPDGEADEGCEACGSSDLVGTMEEAITKLVAMCNRLESLHFDAEAKKLDAQIASQEEGPAGVDLEAAARAAYDWYYDTNADEGTEIFERLRLALATQAPASPPRDLEAIREDIARMVLGAMNDHPVSKQGRSEESAEIAERILALFAAHPPEETPIEAALHDMAAHKTRLEGLLGWLMEPMSGRVTDAAREKIRATLDGQKPGGTPSEAAGQEHSEDPLGMAKLLSDLEVMALEADPAGYMVSARYVLDRLKTCHDRSLIATESRKPLHEAPGTPIEATTPPNGREITARAFDCEHDDIWGVEILAWKGENSARGYVLQEDGFTKSFAEKIAGLINRPQARSSIEKAAREAMEAVEKAEVELAHMVRAQWEGRPALRLSIPARPGHDSDLILADALTKARASLSGLPQEPGPGYLQPDGSIEFTISKAQEAPAKSGEGEPLTCPHGVGKPVCCDCNPGLREGEPLPSVGGADAPGDAVAGMCGANSPDSFPRRCNREAGHNGAHEYEDSRILLRWWNQSPGADYVG